MELDERAKLPSKENISQIFKFNLLTQNERFKKYLQKVTEHNSERIIKIEKYRINHLENPTQGSEEKIAKCDSKIAEITGRTEVYKNMLQLAVKNNIIPVNLKPDEVSEVCFGLVGGLLNASKHIFEEGKKIQRELE